MANFNSQKRKNQMNKKRTGGQQNSEQINGETYVRVRVPNEKELEQFAVVLQLMGTNQVKALCEDGIERQFRIPGKLMKKYG